MPFAPLGSSFRREKDIPRRAMNDPLSVLYSQGQWKLSKATALYNFQYNAVKLKQYASKIKQAIVSVMPANSATKYSIIIECDPQLKYVADDADAIVITVTAQSESNRKNKIVYEAILLSWGLSNTVPNAVHLPYMFERGEQKIGHAVRSTFGTIFDCTFTQFSFLQHHLLQFGFSFIELEASNTDKQIGFTYKTPNVDHKDKLTLHFEIGAVYLILDSVKEEATNPSELVNLTYQTLQNQIFHMFYMDIMMLDLYEISVPKASVKSNGTVTMKTPESVNCVLVILNEMNNINSV